MTGHSTVKALLGYDIADGVSVEDYERWLADIHFPDLLANPFLDRIVADTVVRPITATSAGTETASDPVSFYRIAELHFADHEAYGNYLHWFEDNPIPLDRSPAGRTKFGFYVLADSIVTDRDTPYPAP